MGVLMVGALVDGKVASTDAMTADAMADMRALSKAALMAGKKASTTDEIKVVS